MNRIRSLFLLALILLFVTAAFFMKRVVPFEIQSLLSPHNPARITYEKDQKSFNDEASVWIAISRDTKFDPKEIYQISEMLGRFLKLLNGVESVVTPIDAKYAVVDQQGVQLFPFLTSDGWSIRAKEKLQSNLWKNNLIHVDENAFLISFRVSSILPRTQEKPLFDLIQKQMRIVERTYPGLKTGLLGAKVASAAFLEEMQFQMKVITPLLLLIIGIFLFLCFRSWQIVFWNFIVMIVCYVITLCFIIGVEGGLGPYSSFALMFIFIVSTSDLIHFFSRFQQLNGTVEQRLNEALKISALPCLLTSLTTAAGFFALVVNQNLPVRYFGLYCAFGCLLEWFFIFKVLPHILRAFPFTPRQYQVDLQKSSKWTEGVVDKKAKLIVVVSFVFIGAAALFSFNLNIDDNFYTKFVRSHRLSQSVDLFSQKFQFVGSVDIVVNLKDKDILSNETLESVAELEKELQGNPLVSRITSLSLFNADLKGEIPKNWSSQKAEDLRREVLSLMGHFGALRDLLHESEGRLRIVVFIKSLRTDDFKHFLNDVAVLQKKYEGKLEFRPAGFSVIRSYINNQVIRDFFESFILSFILIFACYWVLYRSVKWSFLALIPNAAPLLAVSGLMGLLNVSVDTNLVILICVAFGISGDNSVHLTYVIRQEMEKGRTYDEALYRALKLIGVALFATSAIFIACLPVFLLGNLRLFGQITLFLSFAFVVAFLTDLFMFPAFQKLMGWKVPLNSKK